ncbi:MAG: HAD family hydrolase [Gammaproteobacteria bacterium]|nr:MAG: HAD family hydrolase [Gammaproteobacteria bacterium]
MNHQRAVFLDRDGVINRAIIKSGKPYPPATLDEVEIIEDVPAALAILKDLGFLLIGATNQPDVARGTTTKEFVETVNAILVKELPLLDIKVCYHDDTGGCYCRKPLPGLLLQAAKEHNIDLTKSIMIGDRWKDIDAGKNAGCQTIWINRVYSEKSPTPDFTTTSLLEAANWIKERQ